MISTLIYVASVIAVAVGTDRFVEHNLVNKSSGTPDATINLIRAVTRVVIGLAVCLSLLTKFL